MRRPRRAPESFKPLFQASKAVRDRFRSIATTSVRVPSYSPHALMEELCDICHKCTLDMGKIFPKSHLSFEKRVKMVFLGVVETWGEVGIRSV